MLLKTEDEVLLEIIQSGINVVKPEVLIPACVHYDGETLRINDYSVSLSSFKNLFVIGFGKASAAMAYEIEKTLGERISGGAVITSLGNERPCKRIHILNGSHPIINEESLSSSEEIIKICKQAGQDDLVLCLISGGGSALFEKLPKGVNLEDIQTLNKLLIKSGASIYEINQIRKLISLVKGGKLLHYIFPAQCLSLIISDVINDDVATIASGPTAADQTQLKDFENILTQYGVINELPPHLLNILKNSNRSITNNNASTPKAECNNIIIGNNSTSIKAARIAAEQFGYITYLVDHPIQDDVGSVATELAQLIRSFSSNDLSTNEAVCIIAGGEPTVCVQGKGLGGRNQELAVRVFLELGEIFPNYIFASCGTDGVDGNSNAAGGIVMGMMWDLVKKKKLDPIKYLKNNDSHNFLNQINGIIPQNPTGTNVMDIIAVVVF